MSDFLRALRSHAIFEVIQDITTSAHTDAIRELAETVLKHTQDEDSDVEGHS